MYILFRGNIYSLLHIYLFFSYFTTIWVESCKFDKDSIAVLQNRFVIKRHKKLINYNENVAKLQKCNRTSTLIDLPVK